VKLPATRATWEICLMPERIRIVVVDDAYEVIPSTPLTRRDLLPVEPIVAADGSESECSIESDSYSLTVLVEWYLALAGAEWQWT
jgi:hypothetical protein